MEIVQGSDNLDHAGLVVAIGNFDGVHLGHRALLARAKGLAEATGALSCVLTFRPHPAKVLRPDQAPAMICDPQDERELIAATGVDLLVEEPFVPALARLTPRGFVSSLLVRRLAASSVVVGYNFRFGRDTLGDVAGLRTLCQIHGVELHVQEPVLVHGEPVSSTRVRAALAQGDLALAADLLGRPPFLSGVVVPGERRGARLGFPTINLAVTTELMPPDGVYAAVAVVRASGRRLPAAAFMGPKRTFGGGVRSVEAHLLGFDGDLYGERVSLVLLHRLRGVVRFPGPRELEAAIAADVARCRELAARARLPGESGLPLGPVAWHGGAP